MDVNTSLPLAALLGTALSVMFQVAVVVLGVIIAWRWLHRPGGAATPAARPQAPVDILAARYARGEIDEAEFASRLRTLAEADGWRRRSSN